MSASLCWHSKAVAARYSTIWESARYTTEDIARLTDYSESEVAEIIDEFEEAGIIRGYQAVVDWNAVENDEERVRATVELNVTLDRETGYDDISAGSRGSRR